jgi:ZIP family zinc transporter
MVEAGLWAAIAAASLLLGAVIAERVEVPRAVVGRAMGFGAGALVAALAYDLVPDTHLADLGVWLAFGVGALVYYVLDGILEARAATDGGSAGVGLALGALLDGLPESLVLGIGIAVGGTVSVGFLAAVFVSNVPESLSSTAALRATRPTTWVYRLWAGIVVASGIAGALGYAVASQMPAVDGRYVQALAAGGVLTMLADTMVPEAFVQGGRPTALLTALGFAIAAVLTTLE